MYSKPLIEAGIRRASLIHRVQYGISMKQLQNTNIAQTK